MKYYDKKVENQQPEELVISPEFKELMKISNEEIQNFVGSDDFHTSSYKGMKWDRTKKKFIKNVQFKDADDKFMGNNKAKESFKKW